MAAMWMKLFLVATATWLVASEYDKEVCSMVKESTGLLPPPLASNFEIKGDHVDVDQKTSMYHEMYVDYSNSLAKYMYLLGGIEHHFLFDYQVQQVVEWDVFHPGVDIKDDPMSHLCEANSLEDSPHRFMFGFLDSWTDQPKMYNAHQMLRFGGNYAYAYDSTDTLAQRGLVVDKFTGCVYDQEMDATIQANYSFTNSKVLSSGGTIVEEVTGVDGGVLSVPAQVEYFGVAMDEESREYKSFRKTENYFWFKGEPEFEWGTFQVPPYMYCEKYRGRKDMPELPKAFSTRLQVTSVKKDVLGKMEVQEVTSYEEIYYYKDKSLARRDFTPDRELDSDIYSKFISIDPVRSIYDFNTGIVYITHKPTGQCYARSIIPGDFFETSKSSIFIQMGDPEDIFGMHSDDMEYKGQAFARDIECDVWVGKKFVIDAHNYTYVKESHFSTNGWHEQADEISDYKVPIKHSNIIPNIDGEFDEQVKTYNFLKFKAATPFLRMFDVSNCISTDTPHMDFAILLTVSDDIKKTIFDYDFLFLEAAQYYIDEYAQTFTPLRVQRLELRQMSQSDSRPLLLFTLVGKHPLKTHTLVGQPGPTLQQSVDLLHRFIDTNSFAITFYKPGDKNSILVTALKGSLYVKTSDGHLQAYGLLEDEEEVTLADDRDFQNVLFDEEIGEDDEEKKGMSDGNLTLLALAMLFIGVGIGIAVMYLYVRKMTESQLEDRITLTPQASIVEAPPMTSGDTRQ